MSDQNQVSQSQTTQSQAQQRELLAEFEYGSTGSPKLHRRTTTVYFTTEPPIGDWNFRRRLLKELEAVRDLMRSYLGPYFEEGEFIVETRLERMLYHARITVVRPHARRLVKVVWRVSWKEMPHIHEAKVHIDYNGYDPPIDVSLCVDDAGGLGVEVDFASEKWQAKYVRPQCVSSSVLKPIDVLALALVLDWLDMIIRTVKAYFLVGEGRSLVVDGLVVNVVYGEGPLMKALSQQAQEVQAQQEGQAQGQEQPQQQTEPQQPQQ